MEICIHVTGVYRFTDEHPSLAASLASTRIKRVEKEESPEKKGGDKEEEEKRESVSRLLAYNRSNREGGEGGRTITGEARCAPGRILARYARGLSSALMLD